MQTKVLYCKCCVSVHTNNFYSVLLIPCLITCSSKVRYTGCLYKHIIWGWMCVQWMHFAFHSPLHFMGVSGMQTSGAALIPFLKIIYLIAFNQLGQCFVRWQWRGLPHAVQILEEVTRGWGRSNDNIGLHSSRDSSCVDTCQSGKAAKALCVCACVCIPEEKASSGGYGVRAPKQTEAQPLGRENKIEIERLRA